MGQRRLVITGDLVVQLSKENGGAPRSFTVDNGLPDDVEIVRYMQQPSRYGAASSSVLWVVLQSDAWEGDELGAGQELDPPTFKVAMEELEAVEVVDVPSGLVSEAEPDEEPESQPDEPVAVAPVATAESPRTMGAVRRNLAKKTGGVKSD